MQHLAKLALSILFAAALAVPVSAAQAASSPEAPPQATLTVKATIDQPALFWNCTYITRNSDSGKPATVNVLWSIGQAQHQEKAETLILPGKSSGKATFVTDKGALVNVRIYVSDAKGVKVGTISLQVRNNGQTEYVTIAPPELCEPKMTWDTLNND